MKDLRNAAGTDEFARLVFDKVFDHDLHRLVSMTEMWKDKRPPVPFSYNNIKETQKTAPTAEKPKQGLRDQQLWTLHENFENFLQAVNALGKRVATSKENLSFDVSLPFASSWILLRRHLPDPLPHFAER